MSKDYMTGGQGKWITFEKPTDVAVTKKNPWETGWGKNDQFAPVDDVGGVALFRKRFSVEGLKSARIDVTSLGLFDLWCNGCRVGRKDENGSEVFDELKPGWTDYRSRVLYYSYDLTPYLREGENTLLAAVAPGWWNGRISLRTYGENNHEALLAAIHLLDGRGDAVYYTDDTWQGAWGGAVRASDIWDGERYDANLPTYEELSKGCNCVTWGNVVIEEHDIFVTPHVGPTVMVRPEMTRKPETVVIYNGTEDNGSEYGKIHVVRQSAGEDSFKLCKGEAAVVDLGQNMVGWPTFTVKGPKDTEVVIRVGEMLNDSGLESRGNDNPEGSIYSVNYRSAKAKAHYVLKGDGNGEYYRPTFTFFGFRYLEIYATEDVEFTGLSCLVVGSATRETGKMETSHPMVNKLISNILWGQRGNYLSVPTDCPQRDERLGWTGDTQAFCGTASYNAEVDGFFHKWLQDARDSQNEAGVYPDVIPTVRVVGFGGAAWSDAGIIVPYTMWKMYGDVTIIREHYESMEKYMGWLEGANMNAPNPHYGDWLAYEGTDARLICVATGAVESDDLRIDSNILAKQTDILCAVLKLSAERSLRLIAHKEDSVFLAPKVML